MLRYLLNITQPILVIFLTTALFLSQINQTFSSAISGIITTAFGISTISSLLDAKNLELKHQKQNIAQKDRQIRQQKKQFQKRKLAVQRYGRSVFQRTWKVATRTISSLPSRTIPIVGSVVVVGGVLWEFRDACQQQAEIAELYREFQVEPPTEDRTMKTVCQVTREYL